VVRDLSFLSNSLGLILTSAYGENEKLIEIEDFTLCILYRFSGKD